MRPIPDTLKTKLRGKVKDIIAQSFVTADVKIANIVALLGETYTKGYTHGHEDAYGQRILPSKNGKRYFRAPESPGRRV